MDRVLAIAIFAASLASAGTDGFVSLMPRQDVGEFWTIENTPPSTWRVRGSEIMCKGTPNGFLRRTLRRTPTLHATRYAVRRIRRTLIND